MEQAAVAMFAFMLILGSIQSSPAPSLSLSPSSLSSDVKSLSSSRHPRSILMLDRRRACSRNTPCMWAYCHWSPRVLLHNADCKYMDSICSCQWGEACSRTDDIRPDGKYFTVTFVCKPLVRI